MSQIGVYPPFILPFSDPENITYFDNIPQLINSDSHQKIIFTSLSDNRNILLDSIKQNYQQVNKIIIVEYDAIDRPEYDCIKLLEECDCPGVEILVTGTINYKFNFIKVHRFENFFNVVVDLYKRLNFKPLNDLKPFSTKSYYFDALLGQQRPNRDWISDQISKFDNAKFIKKYFPASYEWLPDWQNYFAVPSDVTLLELDDVFWSGKHCEYHGLETPLSYVLPIDIYNSSAYSIVAETTESNATNFYTEKTVKTILGKRLAVYFAGQYHLKNLQELGFKTFHGIIDESYDIEPDYDKRRQMAFDQVKFLCEQDQETVLNELKPIVEYNYNRAINTDWWEMYNNACRSIVYK